MGLHHSRRWSFRPMLLAEIASQDQLRGLALHVNDRDEVHRRRRPAPHRRNRDHPGANGFLHPTQHVGWRLRPEQPSDRGSVVSAISRTGDHSQQFPSAHTVSETRFRTQHQVADRSPTSATCRHMGRYALFARSHPGASAPHFDTRIIGRLVCAGRRRSTRPRPWLSPRRCGTCSGRDTEMVLMSGRGRLRDQIMMSSRTAIVSRIWASTATPTLPRVEVIRPVDTARRC